MKSKFFMTGILSMALVFGMMVAGCSDDSGGGDSGSSGVGPEALVGTWLKDGGANSETFSYNDGSKTARFKSNGVDRIANKLESYDGTTATIKQSGDEMITFSAIISGSKLTVSGLSGTGNGFDLINFNGTYTKQ